MRVFFDNCTSPTLAKILDAFIQPQGSRAWHIRFLPDGYALSGSSRDIDWIARLGQDRPTDWIVMTADLRIAKNKAERIAWRQSGLKGFVFAPGFERMPLAHRAATLLWRWHEMDRFITSAASGSMFELPVKRSSGFRPLAI